MLWKIAKAGRDQTVAFAAEELKKYIARIDATQEIAILRYDSFNPELKDVLWLGICPEVAARVSDPTYDDAVSIHVKNAVGAIRGSNPRSVLLGVYRFLKELGCSWIRPGADGEVIPEYWIDEVDVQLDEIPSYRHRSICIEGAVNYDHVVDMIDWLPKVGMNGYFNQFNNPFCFYDRWYSHLSNALMDKNSLTAEEIHGLKDQSIDEIKRRGMMYHEAGHGWTCEPFGIPGETWDHREYNLTPEQTAVMAEVKGKRELWYGVPLNTNLCYSNPTVRSRIADAIVERCKKIPEIDFVQLWLADGSNNHCECAECQKKRPSDWYVTLLNEVDAKMTEAGLRQKVVFLIYVDLLWAPVQEHFNNPDRFVLMFAPITRTYSSSIADCEYFDEKNLPDYVRNKLSFPKSVGENLAWLRKWQEGFKGDSFDFDYHYMWDHFKDPGYYRMAQILFRDMQNLHKVGLNGMVSCQNQRVFFPSGLGMVAMAAALWDEHCDFEKVAADYFIAAFGGNGPIVQEYLRRLSDAFDPVYIRKEAPQVDPEAAKRLRTIPDILDEYAEIIADNVDNADLPDNIRQSWLYLEYHAEMCLLLSKALAARADGDEAREKQLFEDVFSWARQNEEVLHPVFDVFEFQQTYRR